MRVLRRVRRPYNLASLNLPSNAPSTIAWPMGELFLVGAEVQSSADIISMFLIQFLTFAVTNKHVNKPGMKLQATGRGKETTSGRGRMNPCAAQRGRSCFFS